VEKVEQALTIVGKTNITLVKRDATDTPFNPHSADLMEMTGTFEKSQSSPNFLPNF